MARDYKHAARGPRSESRVSSGLLGLVAGFAAGFGAAVLLQVGVPEDRRESPPLVAEQPKAEPKEEPARDDKPRFDFYEMLPNFEVVIPEQDKDVRRSEEVTTVEQPGVYVLQAGSFRAPEDADRLRAQLALLGLESDIQTVTIDDNQTWHRVRIGPYTDLERLNAARSRLDENDIHALVIRLAEK